MDGLRNLDRSAASGLGSIKQGIAERLPFVGKGYKEKRLEDEKKYQDYVNSRDSRNQADLRAAQERKAEEELERKKREEMEPIWQQRAAEKAKRQAEYDAKNKEFELQNSIRNKRRIEREAEERKMANYRYNQSPQRNYNDRPDALRDVSG
jgi:hypothetical protein